LRPASRKEIKDASTHHTKVRIISSGLVDYAGARDADRGHRRKMHEKLLRAAILAEVIMKNLHTKFLLAIPGIIHIGTPLQGIALIKLGLRQKRVDGAGHRLDEAGNAATP